MRPTKDQYFMTIAGVVATRGTCLRRQVGCVLTNSYSHIVATGYNGVARGAKHCNQVSRLEPMFAEEQAGALDGEVFYPNACPGAKAESGTRLDTCEAIHAEQNALLQCHDVETIETCYTTTLPCIHCLKLLLNTGCRRIVYRDDYTPEHRDLVVTLWVKRGGRVLDQLGQPLPEIGAT